MGRPHLHAPVLLRPPLKFNFLGGWGSSLLHYFLILVFPLRFMVGMVNSSVLGKWWGRKPSLGYLLGCFSPELVLKLLLEG